MSERDDRPVITVLYAVLYSVGTAYYCVLLACGFDIREEIYGICISWTEELQTKTRPAAFLLWRDRHFGEEEKEAVIVKKRMEGMVNGRGERGRVTTYEWMINEQHKTWSMKKKKHPQPNAEETSN